ncbi:MAG TPA: autotransporter-associated beta strand repeat-containing protein, partial [Chthoniobacterales bacterium]
SRNNTKYVTFLRFSGDLFSMLFGKLARIPLVGFILLFGHIAYSNDFYWVTNPVDNNWFNPANWSPAAVPGIFDTAHFGASTITDIDLTQSGAGGYLIFDPGAESFTVTALSGAAFEIFANIENNSSVGQEFVSLSGDNGPGSFTFDSSFVDRLTISGEVTFTQHGQATEGSPPSAAFRMSRAGDATFHNLGATVTGGVGGRTDFFYTASSAEQSTIINDGGTAPGAGGGATQFVLGAPTAGTATLIANGGSNGGDGGSFTFHDGSSGGTGRVELFGNGYLDLSDHQPASLRIGSLEGDGIVYLGSGTLIVGASSLSTTFSGLLQPGTPSGGSGTGALSKIGNGTLTLSGASLYTAGTTISAGSLVVSNTAGSATGPGAVSVTAGTLGGSGIIAGAVTVGTGSGTGAFLAPAHGGKKQLTLTIQGSVTFNADATYTYTFKAKGRKSKIDKVIANGVTINSGAKVNLSGTTQGPLTPGATLTLIKNTAATPIVGTFSNLPDGGIVTVNGNNFQVSYAGGDGNDLTLTVVP